MRKEMASKSDGTKKSKSLWSQECVKTYLEDSGKNKGSTLKNRKCAGGSRL